MRICVMAAVVSMLAIAAGSIYLEADQWVYGPPLINDDFMQRATKLWGDKLSPQVLGIQDIAVAFRSPELNAETFIYKHRNGKYSVTIHNGSYFTQYMVLNTREVNRLIDKRHFRNNATRVKDKEKFANLIAKIPKNNQYFRALKHEREIAVHNLWNCHKEIESSYKLIPFTNKPKFLSTDSSGAIVMDNALLSSITRAAPRPTEVPKSSSKNLF